MFWNSEREKPKEPSRQRDVEVLERPKVKRPKKYKVIMHNDDYTTQEFVVHILQRFFKKNPGEANFLMLTVHTKGQAAVGVYTKDVAETKVVEVITYARDNEQPLMLTSEPE